FSACLSCFPYTTLFRSPYNLSSDSMDSIDFWVDRGFSPFIYKGNLMDMVRGRAISRGTFQSKVAAADLIRSLTRVVDTYQICSRDRKSTRLNSSHVSIS